MANFGLSLPTIAKLNPNTGKYSKRFKCSKAIKTSIVPNYASGALFADNIKAEDVKEFKDATVTLGVDSMPAVASEVVFGHKVDEDGTITDRVSDEGNYVGYGFISREMKEGKKRYRACLLRKVKFQEGEESYDTKGDNITFGTPTLTGSAVQIGVGEDYEEWRKKSPYFETEKAADDWINKFFDDNAEAPGTGEETGTGGSGSEQATE